MRHDCMEIQQIPPAGSLLKVNQISTANVYCPESRYNRATNEVSFLHVTRHGQVWSSSKLFWEAN